MTSQALVASRLRGRSSVLTELFFLALGVCALAALSQIQFRLPWTPVPITGQTLGVAIIALNWGRHRAPLIFLSYLAIGFLGAPVFAGGASGLLLGPTLGYLVGMGIATFVVGFLADRGATGSFTKSLASAYVGSAIIFACGLYNLSFYVPSEALLAAGLFPFLVGDLIKNLIAASSAKVLKSRF